MSRSRFGRRFEQLEPRLPVFDLLGLGLAASLVDPGDELWSQESPEEHSHVSILGDSESDRPQQPIPLVARPIALGGAVEAGTTHRAQDAATPSADSFVPEADSALVFQRDSSPQVLRSAGSRSLAADVSFATANLPSGQGNRAAPLAGPSGSIDATSTGVATAEGPDSATGTFVATSDDAPPETAPDAPPSADAPSSDDATATASGGVLRMASPETDIITPFQRYEPADEPEAGAAVFDGQFVVELESGVSSPELAAHHGFQHEFAYPNLQENLNVWSLSDSGMADGPVVRTFDAKSLDEQAGFLAYDQAFGGGVRVATGDVSGDGVLDTITGAGPGGGPHVRVFDGSTQEQLPGAVGSFYAYHPDFSGGVFVASGDVNGDGRDDVITGAGPGGGPHVRVYSGLDGAELFGFYAYNPNFGGGVSVAAADVNGDGNADIITGAGAGGGPHVRVFSGLDGSELFGFYAYDPNFGGGVFVAAGDADGDGLADVYTGAGAGGGPHVRVISGEDWTQLHGFFAYDSSFSGGVRVAAGDLDGDGLSDIITGAGPGGQANVRAFSGADRSQLADFFAYAGDFEGGVYVAAGANQILTSADQLPASAEQDAESVALFLQADPAVVDSYPVYIQQVTTNALLNDPLLPAQWHLSNSGQTGGTAGLDANVSAAWDMGYTGQGVTIGIVDDGLQSTHPDLDDRFDPVASYDFAATDDDPSPVIGNGIPLSSTNPLGANAHGTAVAGVAAAVGNNGLGGSGAAPNATLGGLRLIAGNPSLAARLEALTWNTTKTNTGGGGFDASRIDIYNNSWGPVEDSIATPHGLESAVNESAVNGRGGLGSIYVWSGGNSRTNNADVNYTGGTKNNRRVIAVAAVAHDGSVASYSNPGAPLLISAPSNGQGDAITTTDLITTDITSSSRSDTPGYTRTNYTNNFSGTSSAAPLVSGVVALILEANPNLTYRDVQHILVESASRQGLTTNSFNANQTGRFFSHDYGFGLINAAGAVNLARNWQAVRPELMIDSGERTVNAPIPEFGDGSIERTFTVTTPDIKVETVEVVLDATHPNRGNLKVELEHLGTTTTSTLANTRSQDPNANYSDYVFTTRADWGENSSGDWRIRITDGTAVNTGTWNSYQLRIYGTEIPSATAPRVANVEVTANQIMQGSLSNFQVQFDQPIDAATFTNADIGVTRIEGASMNGVAVNNPTVVADTNNRVFNVTLPTAQNAAANYKITIGPAILGTNTLQMDQNLNSADGNTAHSQMFDMGSRLMFTRATAPPFGGTTISEAGSFSSPFASIPIPAGGITNSTILDLNVLMHVRHGIPNRDIDLAVQGPSPALITIFPSTGNPLNTSGEATNTLNGYWDTLLDDESPNGSIDQLLEPNAYNYTDSYQPRAGHALSAFDGATIAGTWPGVFFDDTNEDGHLVSIHDYSLIFTPNIAAPDVRIDAVENLDGDNMIDVKYTVLGSTAGTITFGVYNSRDPGFDPASDSQLTTFTAPTGTVGVQQTVSVNASSFPDPSFLQNFATFGLVVADPNAALLDPNRSNNVGTLRGVTQSPDGTLWVAGNPFTSNTITVTNSAVNFNGTNIAYTAANINDIVLTGSTEADTITATGTGENTLAFLGLGNDTYLGGSGIDAVQAGAGDDTLTGGAGNDRLYGMLGKDSVDGGADDDTVSVGQGGLLGATQTLTGGAGADYVFIDGTDLSDRIMIWDPDGTSGSAPLQAVVSSPANVAYDPTRSPIEPGILAQDSFGYLAREAVFDSTLDLSAATDNTLIDNEDDLTTGLSLGANSFNFYGQQYTSVRVSTNGLISVPDVTFPASPTNSALSALSFPAIAPLWDDWQTDVGANSTVLSRLDTPNNRLIIEWNQVPHFSGVGAATFQAILQLNTGSTPGNITFNYPDLDVGNASFNNGAAATVGIKDISSLQLAFNGSGSGASLLGSSKAIQFAGPTLNAIAPVVLQRLAITVDAFDTLLVNASLGNDFVQLESPAVAGSKVSTNAILIGGPGSDTLHGGLGVDRLFGDSGYNIMSTDGIDTFHTPDGGNDVLIVTSGVDVFTDRDVGDTLIVMT